MAKRIAQVRVRTRDPVPRVRKLRIIQMPRGQHGARRGPMAHIEMNSRAGDVVPAHESTAPQKLRCQVPVSHALELERQKSQLFEGIEPAEVRIKLQAVDHAERRPEADVLGFEIAMSIDHMRPTLCKCGSRASQALELRTGHLIDEPLLEASAEALQLASIGGNLPAQPPYIGLTVDRVAARAPEEFREAADHAVELHVGHRPGRQRPVEHPCGWQAAHLDQPVFDTHARPECEGSAAIGRQRYDRQTDGRRKTPVEAQFLAAALSARGERPVIHGGLALRFLELVSVTRSKKDPCKVRLDDLDAPFVSGVTARIAQERDFALESCLGGTTHGGRRCSQDLSAAGGACRSPSLAATYAAHFSRLASCR